MEVRLKMLRLTAATLTLATPGDPNSLGHNKALIVDTTVPTVTELLQLRVIVLISKGKRLLLR